MQERGNYRFGLDRDIFEFEHRIDVDIAIGVDGTAPSTFMPTGRWVQRRGSISCAATGPVNNNISNAAPSRLRWYRMLPTPAFLA